MSGSSAASPALRLAAMTRRSVVIAILLAMVSGTAGDIGAHLLSGTQSLDPEVARAIKAGNVNAAQQAAYDGAQLVPYETVMTVAPPVLVFGGFVLLAAHRRGGRTRR